ncbi:MAG: VOC family protein, partial [Gammaproteobacteria bacterium]|nr:VOC family protein [Gammaproteobacteria bacterium]
MIGYVTVGTNDLERAGAFWDALLAELGAARTMEGDNFVMWSTGPDAPFFIAIKPHDGKPATVGNGCMTGLKAASRAQVDA